MEQLMVMMMKGTYQLQARSTMAGVIQHLWMLLLWLAILRHSIM